MSSRTWASSSTARRSTGSSTCRRRSTRRSRGDGAREVPFVLVNRYIDSAQVDTVVSDNLRGGRLVADAMVELGHRRIALIAGPENTTTSRDRERGFREQLQARGVPFDESLRRVGQFSHRSGYQWCLDLLAAETPPTAVFAANDVIAFGALDAARRVGVRVPAELSIVGFDDIDMAGWEGFNLTTVRQPLAEMGRAAAKLLIGADRLERRGAPVQARLPRRPRPPGHARGRSGVLRRSGGGLARRLTRPRSTLYAYVCIALAHLVLRPVYHQGAHPDVHQSFERKGRMTMRRKTLRWVSLAALAVGRSRLRRRRAGSERPEGRARRQERRRHHLHEPEPVLRRLGEHGQERPREAGRERDRPHARCSIPRSTRRT